MEAKHVRHRKITPAKVVLVLVGMAVGAIVAAALIYSIINPSPHGPQSHPKPSVSTSAPTHAKPSPKPTAPAPRCTAPSKPKPSHGVTPTPSKPLPVRYTVKLGDNLSSIAYMYHLPSYVPLYNANHAAIGNNPNLIHVGLQLTVPTGKGT